MDFVLKVKRNVHILLVGNVGVGAVRNGNKHTQETKNKISNTLKGKYMGDKSSRWKGGKYTDYRGYILIKDRNHPYCKKDGYVYEHRLIMEKHLGRFLEPEESIHHINGIKNDNRLDNLQLYKNERDHQLKDIEMEGSFVAMIHSGKILKIFASAGEAERTTGIDNGAIAATCRSKRKSAGGFNWKCV